MIMLHAGQLMSSHHPLIPISGHFLGHYPILKEELVIFQPKPHFLVYAPVYV